MEEDGNKPLGCLEFNASILLLEQKLVVKTLMMFSRKYYHLKEILCRVTIDDEAYEGGF